MADEFSNVDTVDSSARNVFLIVPHDVNPLANIPKAIRCDVAGVLVYRAVDDAADVTMNLSQGETLLVRAQYVRATGTSGTYHGMR